MPAIDELKPGHRYTATVEFWVVFNGGGHVDACTVKPDITLAAEEAGNGDQFSIPEYAIDRGSIKELPEFEPGTMFAPRGQVETGRVFEVVVFDPIDPIHSPEDAQSPWHFLGNDTRESMEWFENHRQDWVRLYTSERDGV